MRLKASAIRVDNHTNGISVKASDYIDKKVSLKLKPAKEGPQILIMHTHTTEAYSKGRKDTYKETDTARSTDNGYNMGRGGEEMKSVFEDMGLSVVHDKTKYDYPSYTGSYSRSGAAVEEYLAQNPDQAVVIALHRDALGDGDVTYKTMAELDGQTSSQLMMLVGTGEGGLSHPNWEQNLRLALYLQPAVTAKYPTLARPISVTQERYNQQLTTGSMILEVGSSGNTLQEALTAVRLYADAVGPALLKLVAEN